MRFLLAIKSTRIGHLDKEISWRSNEVHFAGLREHPLHSAHYLKRSIQSSNAEIRGVVSCVGKQLPYGGSIGRVLQCSKLLRASMLGFWRSICSTGGTLKTITGLKGRSGYCTMFETFCRAKPSQMGIQERSIAKAYDPGLPRRPVILEALAVRKGQVAARFFSWILAGSFLFHDMPAPKAEQFHGKMVINSMNPRRLSVGAQAITYFRQTVETIALLSRAIYLLLLFTPTLFLAPFAGRLGGQVRIYWLQILLATLENAGPAFIKWGQWAATRPDMFPQDVCDWLAKLHMQAPSHTFQQTRKMCEKAFRIRLEDVFEEFSEEPVASGSIAQVHRAVLKPQSSKGSPGQVVAVKVRHPGISKVIQRDFVIIKWLANVSTIIPGLQPLQLDKTVQHFASFMTKQVDLTLEAAHLLRFIYNFRTSHNVSFPVPIYPWVHPGVLVETYEEGQSIANFVDLTTILTPTHTQLAYIGSSALLKMLLMDNFIHGDLHPGNIFVRFIDSRPNVILLDVGMTAELNQRSRDILIKLFEAVAKKDGMNVAKWTLQFSEDQSCPDPEAFARDVDLKFKEYLSIRGTAKNTGECMSELFDQVRKHRVNIDGDVCTVMVTTLILEGWQRKLDPDLDIITMVGDLLLKREWQVPYDYVSSAIAAP